MAQQRMNRDEFFTKMAALDESALRTALWTLYWRGAQPVRERIEAILDPQTAKATKARAALPPDAQQVLSEVQFFTSIALDGGYIGGTRLVSPKERSNWRITFRRLVSESLDALRGDAPDTAAAAVTLMIDLACQCRVYDYFRSEDPVQAARFVVSDAVEMLWLKMREMHGATGFLETAVAQLVRWESAYGWTRRGDGSVAEKETKLAIVLSRLLTVPDLWATAARFYLAELDKLAAPPVSGKRSRRSYDGWSRSYVLSERTLNLRDWNRMLLERLDGSDESALLDRLVVHPALGGVELTMLQVTRATQRRDFAKARRLIADGAEWLRGQEGYEAIADEIAAMVERPAV